MATVSEFVGFRKQIKYEANDRLNANGSYGKIPTN